MWHKTDVTTTLDDSTNPGGFVTSGQVRRPPRLIFNDASDTELCLNRSGAAELARRSGIALARYILTARRQRCAGQTTIHRALAV